PNPRHFTLGGEKSQIDTGDLHAPMVQTLSFMPVSRFRGLWLKIALPVLGFTMLGSLVLLYWLHTAAERESAHLFATLARTNAEFLRSSRLPGSERVAEHLGS